MQTHPVSVHDRTTIADILISFFDFVESVGADANPLLDASGIDPEALNEDLGHIPLKAVAQLLEISATSLQCTDLGMRLAQYRNRKNPLDSLADVAPTLRDLFDYLPREADVGSSGVRLTHKFQPYRDRWEVRFDVMPEILPVVPQLTEYWLLITHIGACHLTGGLAKAREVWISHSRLSSLETYRAHFGTTVKFSQEYDALIYTDQTFEMKLLGSDRSLFTERLNRLSPLYPTRSDPVEIKTRDALRILLPNGEGDRGHVAEFLKMSPRALNRKLNENGKSFEIVRDELRQALALRYLAHSDLPLSEVANKLGYAETAVFTRSCRRWFERTPRALRREMGGTWWLGTDADGHELS